ncbi:RHOMBOID-like protein 12, mitochondrial [Rosa rugosa]|uniref:RHOMBOID-like protein 12, mitochondrial n=1 Tax=Rosa rugosa TaxID=74645 RepID=UPI002B414C28|nr:RHOMBOID-like protein 12, mitochondrial [Rosa rugosa]
MQRLLSVKLASNLPKTLSSSTTSSSLFHFQPHKTFSLTKPPQNLFFSSFPTHPLQHQHNLSQKVHGFFSNPLLRKHFSLDSANTLLRVSSKRLSYCRLAFLQRKTPKQNFQFFPSSDAHLSARRSWYGRVSSNDVLLGLILANFAVFLLWKIADPVFMVKNFTLSLYSITSGRLHTLITSAFSHLVVEDILLNMFLLSVFGNDVGRTFGPEFLLKLYLAGAIGGSVFYLVQYVLLASKDGDLSNSPILTLGAQGAVTAVMYFDLLQLCTRIPAFLYYLNILLMAYQIGDSISRIIQGNSSSGNAHVGGAAVATIAWVRLRMGLRVF